MWSKFKLIFNRYIHSFTNNNSTIKTNSPKVLKNESMMKVLNVAEKNDAAKNIANLLGRGNCRRREGLSVYNKIFEFDCTLWNQNCQMVMTSVSGHLLTFEFGTQHRGWNSCPPSSLFDAPVSKICLEKYQNIKRTLQNEIRSCNALIIWTDCDREGENIGFEIIKVCQEIKPQIQIYRAVFSEITSASVHRALQNLVPPKKLVSDAVDVRSELDLRIGAAFTRFQTLRLKQVFPETLADLLISYGSCQFPTLGFVVERYLAIEKFVPEPYWKLKVSDVRNDVAVEFRWARNRLFEKLPCQIYLDICLENPEATVEKVNAKPKSKWRPLPLDTVELEKQGSRKLRLNAKETMRIAEKLYSQGFISYPRTETNIFPKELNLTPLVTQQTQHQAWGEFATRVLNEGINPRQGKKSDQAHPPIHPIKFTNSLQGNEAKVYEFVVRHFLACVSKNAEGHETIVDIDISGEKFIATGLQIIAKNYLEVYIYEKWNAKEIHYYQMGQKFRPTEIIMVEEKTSAPNLLTEADLIALMDKHGIGTDATHAEHIDTIKQRHYVGMQDERHLTPGKLGIGLVMGYDNMGFQMSKPNLRAELERDLKLICDGQKNAQDVLKRQIDKYREVFRIATEKANLIDTALATYIDETPKSAGNNVSTFNTNPSIFKCPKCKSDMIIRTKRQGTGKFYIGCSSFPNCRNAIWFPEYIEDITVTEPCSSCSAQSIKKLKIKFQRNVNPQFGLIYEACLGCDIMFKQFLGIDDQNIVRVELNRSQSNDSGYNTSHDSRNSTVNRNQFNLSHNTTNSYSTNQSQRSSSLNLSNQSSSRGSQNQQWNRNSSSTNNGDVILCYCHIPAIELTVRKEGPTQGQKFYKCAKPKGEGCTFFLWKDENDVPSNSNNAPFNPPPPPPPSSSVNKYSRTTNYNNQENQWNQTASTSWSTNDSTTESVLCNCGEPAKKFTVQKENANKGRQFYSCPKGTTSTCNFFKWADEQESGQSIGRGRGRGGYSQRGAGSTQRRPRATGAKRKCGICGVEGHTKKTCYQNAMD